MPKGNGKPIPQVEVHLKPNTGEVTKLLEKLETRFSENKHRHKGVSWADVQKKIVSKPAKIASLFAMEETGGEPDVVMLDGKTLVFVDCSEQSPDRRSICYDAAGEQLRHKKGVNPGGNAFELAEKMGIELLDEAQYRALQKVDVFDTKTSSWIATPESIRKLGGALFCDCRYETVFTYHNGAESFYSARGFRGLLEI